MNDPLQVQQRVRRQVRRRRIWRRTRTGFLVVLSAAVVLAAAFGIDRLAVVVHKFYADHHHASKPGHGHNQTAATTTTTIAGSQRCNSPQLSAVVSDWRETSGTVQEIVSLTNISQTPCTLTGYPGIGVGAQGGTPLPAPNADSATLVPVAPSDTTTIPVPSPSPTGPSPTISLLHGARAWFELSFANVCAHVLQPGQAATGAPNECYAGVWLEVTPPMATSPLLVTQPVRLNYATAGFQVGAFRLGTSPALIRPTAPAVRPTTPTTQPPAPPTTTATTVPVTPTTLATGAPSP